MRLAVVILAHNAVRYVFKAIRSLRKQRGLGYDLILVDNGSGRLSRFGLFVCSVLFRTNIYVRSRNNRFFAGGMNLGASVANRDVTHLLMLNSDTEFLDPCALEKICRAHLRGATGLRVIEKSPVTIADGFFFLIDRDVFEQFGGLDEQFPWTRAITKLQAQVLRAGLTVQAVRHYDHLLQHFGGKSGDAWKSVHIEVDASEIARWFEGLPPVTVIPEIARLPVRHI
jgi:GT2 family glycosyltransferase